MIPVAEPYLSEHDIALVNEALRSGWISSAGKFLDLFEERWSAYCDMPFGIAVSNGSVALDVAVGLLDLQPGDEVIMPTFTIISPAQSIVRAGGVPVLVDSDPSNLQMDVTQIEGKITGRTKAILVVHIYGHPADMDPILEIARKYGLKIIEDAAEVHGAEYKGKRCGSFGDISTFSFYANKLVTTGEGGMVLVRTPELAERARSLRNLCFQKQQRFLHDELGFNFRLTNVQAAMGVGQIERIEEIVARKRAIAAAYHTLLGGLPTITLQREETWAKNVYWVYALLIEESTGLTAAQLSSRLREHGIETRPFFLGMHQQPAFHRMGLFHGESYPVAERLALQGLYIPSGLTLSDSQITQVADAVKVCLS
ncbi:DegT/DnrJ/EryC1/StrS aminotransferase family protein [Geobacter sp. SVR]|uniref:DegT/DnrJ/EryC1/StrS family aminotransferase n=1 Tax=Geobacter sp. SVR TaxID=2495594 RepID=UPI00143EFB68|nr:DegT/DnrJ/EryC1/StrS family aminotransferase [Geobacter sp. SVR]BCS55959.1 aminotransferase DegT [Geobacter sp. SVR]GCF84722.1 aminotransferase DegT [Geobacter sp. SVR]